MHPLWAVSLGRTVISVSPMAKRYGTFFIELCMMIAALAGLPEISEAAAPDGKRQTGKFVSFGVGPAYTSVTKEVTLGSEELSKDRTKKGAAAIDFKLGRTFLESSLWTYSVARAIWFRQESALVTNASLQVGISVYLQKAPPAVYWLASVGLSNWRQDPVSHWGLGVSGGLGYELPNNWRVETIANFGFANSGKGSFNLTLPKETKRRITSVLVTINKVFFRGS